MTLKLPEITCRPFGDPWIRGTFQVSLVDDPGPSQCVTLQPVSEGDPGHVPIPLFALGDNLSPSMTYHLYRGNEVSLLLGGPAKTMFVPSAPSGDGDVEVGSKWQMMDYSNRVTKPYYPSAEQSKRMSEFIKDEQRRDPLRERTNPQSHDTTLTLNRKYTKDVRAVVRPGFTLLVPLDPSLSRQENWFSGARQSNFLLLDEDVDINAEKRQQVFKGKVTSYGYRPYGLMRDDDMTWYGGSETLGLHSGSQGSVEDTPNE
ncbi:hypothetical protein I302_107357 [Kwoniella bestiolae CBS 10118]|uniref:Uncharacterized protein n=1 Tax=Kwoniella bestiolae CBS 10118 TaxID=1296100 RepID=A0A1B9FYS6_9TREE|nr:hypothetical protein I302_06905 [Kwoniella bestiolae CBS 10118]OCF23919.1 hypothetical protein I302_06905 [Kwoniella bestiolae CBS 10118]